MEGTKRLQRLYSLAKENRIAMSKKEFAAKIGMSYTTFVRTINGDPQYSPNRAILAAEDFLRAQGVEDAEMVTLDSIMKELQEQRKMIEKLLNLAKKGHI